MSFCRHLCSIDRVWRAAIATENVLQGSILHSKGLHLKSNYLGNIRKMSGARGGAIRPGSKRKIAIPQWRKITTQSSSFEVSSQMNLDAGQGAGTVSDDARQLNSCASDVKDSDLNKVKETTSVSIAIETDSILHQQHLEDGSVGKHDPMHESSSEVHVEFASETAKHYSTVIEVGAPLIGFVKGKLGYTQRLIEQETGVKLVFPSSKHGSFINIEATSAESVTQASEKIRNIVEAAVKSRSLDYSHFISLPLAVHGELVDKLMNFQNSILGEDDFSQDEKSVKVEVTTTFTRECNASRSKPRSKSGVGIDRSIFIKPKTFHLTVLMLKLYNKDRIASATKVLQSISSQVKDVLDNRPLSIRLKGLACMKGSPSSARVIYAPVEEIGGEGRLLRACRVIIDAYVEAGLVLKEDARQALKLHATLINVRHSKSTNRTKKFDSIDACDIFKTYGSEEWGEYLIHEAHLSQRFKFDERGYYHCCSSITFPQNMQIE